MLIDQITCCGISIRVIRDDLFPFIGGGAKARKAVAYERCLKAGGYNAIVTCGGIQSNHNRAIALMAARNGWKCHLIVQGEREKFLTEKGNALLCRLSGAYCECVTDEQTSEAMDMAMDKFLQRGLRPYYIHGGGHDLPGGTCFVDAVKELKRQSEDGYRPDYIFLASGTGSTQAGIIVGCDLVGWGTVKVIGVSVARQCERGKQVIIDFSKMLGEYYGIKKDYTNYVNFCTDYLFGGYEQFTPEMTCFLERATKETGLVFDTTYSGKAFFGMIDYVKKHGLQNRNLIFWHTGGLMNIMR